MQVQEPQQAHPEDVNPSSVIEGARLKTVDCLHPQREHAEKFIEALTGHKDAPVTFQTFSEGGPPERPASILHGTLDQRYDELVRLNRAGSGIFVMVNEGDGLGRRAQNVIALRALFTDDDGDGPEQEPSTAHLPPTLEVESAHGAHKYWALKPGEPPEKFTKAQEALAWHFGTDPMVKDLPRVMRVPGFFHQKDRASPFLVTVTEVRPHQYTIAEVLAAFPAGVEAANEPTAGRERPERRKSGKQAGGVEKKKSAVFTSIAVRRAKAYLSRVPGAVQDDHGDDATYRVACTLVCDFFLPFDAAMPVFKGWNETCKPPWSEEALAEKLRHAAEYATGEPGSKLAANGFQGTEDLCYLVPLGRYFLRLPGGQWDLGAPLAKDAARKHLSALGVPADHIGEAFSGELMLLAHGIDCSPGDEAVFVRDGRYIVNNYRPSRVVPAPGKFPRIKAIIEAVVDGDEAGYAWLWNWMAAKYQNPGARSRTAPVFQGAQGIGKTKLGLILAELLGAENTACISQPDIDSSFNGHFAGKLMVLADEVVSQENLKDTASVLKKYLTDPRLMVNVKNVPQHEVENRMSWWFTSNSLTPVKVEGPTDRRYTVFSAMKPPTSEYKAMLEGIHQPGGGFTPDFAREMAAFAHALREHPFDATAAGRPFLNAARDALIKASANSAELFLSEVAEEGVEAVMAEHLTALVSQPRWDFGEDGVLTDAFFTAYRLWCEATGAKPFKKENLGQHVRQVFPNAERRRITSDGRRRWSYTGLPRKSRA